MPNRLTGLKVDMVSLVDRAAVRDPQRKSEPRRFLLWKAEDAPATPDTSKEDHVTDTATETPVEKAEQELKDAIAKAEAAGVDIEKLGTKGNPPPPGDDPTDKDDIDAAKNKVSKDTTSDGGAEGADGGNGVSKSEGLSPEVKAILEKAENERITLAKRVEAAESVAKAERDLRVEREFIAKAEQDYANLSVDATEIGPVLKRASEVLEKADYDAITAALRGADEAVYQGDLFKEMGKGGTADAAPDAYGKLLEKAQDIRKADSTVSEGDALEKAMQIHPELAADYLREARGSLR